MGNVEQRLSVKISSGVMAGISWTPDGCQDVQPALVFAHANGFCASTYRTLLSDLAEATGRLIVGLDLRGHGRSLLPANPDYQDSWNRHARDLSEALEHIAPQGCVLAGHSMGATSALLTCARVPDLVKGLCLFDPVLGPRGFYLYAKLPWVFDNWRKHFPMARAAGNRRARFPSREAAIAAYTGRGAFKGWPQQTIIDYCEDGFRDLPDGSVTLSCTPTFEAACFAGQRHNPHAALRSVRGPAVLLRAAKGSTTPALVISTLERHGLEVATVKGASHFLPMEQPEKCRLAMADIISQVDRSAGLAGQQAAAA
jgi:pimeloyl-ACP methyl ester carboxylesterase